MVNPDRRERGDTLATMAYLGYRARKERKDLQDTVVAHLARLVSLAPPALKEREDSLVYRVMQDLLA